MDYDVGDTVVCVRQEPDYPPELRCVVGSFYKVAAFDRCPTPDGHCQLCGTEGFVTVVQVEGQPATGVRLKGSRIAWWAHCPCEFAKMSPLAMGLKLHAEVREPEPVAA